MKDQFVLLLNNSYLNSGIPCNSGQFTADQTFHYKESTLYTRLSGNYLNSIEIYIDQGCLLGLILTDVDLKKVTTCKKTTTF